MMEDLLRRLRADVDLQGPSKRETWVTPGLVTHAQCGPPQLVLDADDLVACQTDQAVGDVV